MSCIVLDICIVLSRSPYSDKLGVFRYIWQQLDMKLSYLLYCNLEFCL